jgi:hypothetical protein
LARTCSTTCLPAGKDDYCHAVADPRRFRAWLDTAFRQHPELFPTAFAHGYRLKGARTSRKPGLRLRRVRLKATAASFPVRPSFVAPHLTGLAADVEGPLFLRASGVPFWALARAFGKGPTYWYRLELGPGRNSIAGTTARRADLPRHLLADEYHQTRGGENNYVAATVGAACVLGCALAPTAGAEDLRAAYGVFKREARDVRPGYRPRAVNGDGWAATRQAWRALFPLAVLLRCFRHGRLNIRSRGKLSAAFAALPEKVWHAYRAANPRGFAQRLRRLKEWPRGQELTAWLLGQVEELCARSGEYGRAYGHPEGHRTSNVLDRLMRPTSRYFEDAQHPRGSQEACALHCRAWALLHNFRPWRPATARANEGWQSPAERLNRHRYHDCWLQNLLASASLGGYRR